MKVGDKLYCTNTLTHDNINYFIKNKYYTIIDVYPQTIKVLDELGGYYINWFFETQIESQQYDQYKLNDYFISIKEHRKLKLEKLNR